MTGLLGTGKYINFTSRDGMFTLIHSTKKPKVDALSFMRNISYLGGLGENPDSYITNIEQIKSCSKEILDNYKAKTAFIESKSFGARLRRFFMKRDTIETIKQRREDMTKLYNSILLTLEKSHPELAADLESE